MNRVAFLRDFPMCANPDCGKDHNPPKKHRHATEIHHTRGRIGKLYLDSRYWLPMCHPCHEFINANPNVARALGLLCAPGQWGKQPETEFMPRNIEAFQHDYRVYLRCKEEGDTTATEPPGDPYGLGDWEVKKLKEQIEAKTYPPPALGLSEMIQEAQRELAVRERVYPRWVAEGKLARQIAEQRTAAMLAIVCYLRRQKMNI